MMNNDELIWYVCYGSNLCYDRFMEYIDWCLDDTPPRKQKVITIPYEMYFGNSSERWENGGVCFINTSKDITAKTIARAYLITYEQFLDIKEQEGNDPHWYGHVVELDNIDGIRALTFTSFYKNFYNPPCSRYLEVIKNGLMECGLSEGDATEYLNKRI